MSWTGLFRAMDNPMPECPSCRSQKLEDWGDSVGPMGWIRTESAHPTNHDTLKSVDQTLNRLAHAHDMTNISNTGGKAAKGGAVEAPVEKGVYGNLNVGGFNVPINGDFKTMNFGSNAKVKSGVQSKVNSNAGTALAPHTQVTARHK